MQTTLRIDREAGFLPQGGELRITQSERPAPIALTTSVHGLCFLGDKILMVNDRGDRGWNIPGGHIERGESFEAALRRELREEAAASVERLRPVAYYHIRIEGADFNRNGWQV
jgi:8-oxo-dGTP pyrophosphatase MutT (NUDIX family)